MCAKLFLFSIWLYRQICDLPHKAHLCRDIQLISKIRHNYRPSTLDWLWVVPRGCQSSLFRLPIFYFNLNISICWISNVPGEKKLYLQYRFPWDLYLLQRKEASWHLQQYNRNRNANDVHCRLINRTWFSTQNKKNN